MFGAFFFFPWFLPLDKKGLGDYRCYWHLVGIGQRCHKQPKMHRPPTQTTKDYPTENVSSVEVEEVCTKQTELLDSSKIVN